MDGPIYFFYFVATFSPTFFVQLRSSWISKCTRNLDWQRLLLLSPTFGWFSIVCGFCFGKSNSDLVFELFPPFYLMNYLSVGGF